MEEEITGHLPYYALSLSKDCSIEPGTDTSYLPQFIKGAKFSFSSFPNGSRFCRLSDFERYSNHLKAICSLYPKTKYPIGQQAIQAFSKNILASFPSNRTNLSTLMNTLCPSLYRDGKADTVYAYVASPGWIQLNRTRPGASCYLLMA
jgi:hypothetical protein